MHEINGDKTGESLAEMSRQPRLAIIMPCYDEEEALQRSSSVVCDKLQELIDEQQITSDSFVLMVDDGSTDKTWKIISQLHAGSPERFHGLKFAHNKGHQNALYAGLMHSMNCGADACITLDADLQDDPNAISDMVEQYRQGSEIVLGVRDSRATDTPFKRGTAHLFYKIMKWMGTETVPDHADYRLMSRTAVEALSRYSEVNLFLRGIVPSLGFRTSVVYYKRSQRVAGQSKYPLRKMVSFALDGITSFSVKPLRFIATLGWLSIIAGLVMLIYTLHSLFNGQATAGWASIMCSLWILGGLILISLGVIGEYIGRIYLEVKGRPRYIIEESI